MEHADRPSMTSAAAAEHSSLVAQLPTHLLKVQCMPLPSLPTDPSSVCTACRMSAAIANATFFPGLNGGSGSSLASQSDYAQLSDGYVSASTGASPTLTTAAAAGQYPYITLQLEGFGFSDISLISLWAPDLSTGLWSSSNAQNLSVYVSPSPDFKATGYLCAEMLQVVAGVQTLVWCDGYGGGVQYVTVVRVSSGGGVLALQEVRVWRSGACGDVHGGKAERTNPWKITT